MLKYMKCCFNWKVVAGLAVVALGLWIAAPDVIGRALPTLVALICPLSMVAMMIGMGVMSRKEEQAAAPPIQQGSAVSRGERLRQLELERLHIQAEMDQAAAELQERQSIASSSL